MQETNTDLKSMTLTELTQVMKENGFPAFRAGTKSVPGRM